MALSGKVPLEVFRANCEDDKAAKRLHADHESKRVMQAAVNDAMRAGPSA